MTAARRLHVRGVVQGVGFRPCVYRLARAQGLTGWVANGDEGVDIHVEGGEASIEAFVRRLGEEAPPAAHVAAIEAVDAPPERLRQFEIRESRTAGRPTVRISPDLPVCDACVRELFDAGDRRCGYPYITCSHCGPRYSIVRALPYDRARTTMAGWVLCEACAREFHDPADRRFHAQPVACPACGPHYRLVVAAPDDGEALADRAAIAAAAALLNEGRIVAVKGIGGYHLACDAANAAAVAALRTRKFRKEQAFALMVRDLALARDTCRLSRDAESLLLSPARPIVLAPRRVALPGVAPESAELGVMLPYSPVHHLLFAHGAPGRLVMTSGNRSSEPIAFEDADAFGRLQGLADAFLAGDRPIARRVDDSVVRAGARGTIVVRRSRGLAPNAVVSLPAGRPVLALGSDLKNTITLVVGGQAYVSQHIGDLAHYEAREACRRTAWDLMGMYAVGPDDLVVAHDRHPEYASTQLAWDIPSCRRVSVQHHEAHVASVLAERGALDRRVIGVALDGTGYGDDGSTWGGELFVGSVEEGFARIAHLRPAALPGGDAAARHPVQAAAGFLDQIDGLRDLRQAPFGFPDRYERARALVRGGVRTFTTTSAGRLFDAAAALAGFTRPITFEGQAAMWLEHLARRSGTSAAYDMAFDGTELDWRPLLAGMAHDRARGVDVTSIARAFHRGLARGVAHAVRCLCERFGVAAVALSGGVLQNDVLLSDIHESLSACRMTLWVNHAVPPNDGGVSLGQAALAIAASRGAAAA